MRVQGVVTSKFSRLNASASSAERVALKLRASFCKATGLTGRVPFSLTLNPKP